jgi:hypothetical protein
MTHLDLFSASVCLALSVATFLGEFLLDFFDFSLLSSLFPGLANFVFVVAESGVIAGTGADITGGVWAVVAELTTDSEEVAVAGGAAVELTGGLANGVGLVLPGVEFVATAGLA